MNCENVKECPCLNTECKNYKQCCDCVVQHRTAGNLPSCLRPATEESK